jgi:Leucine-rich repeat (LRR) protein
LLTTKFAPSPSTLSFCCDFHSFSSPFADSICVGGNDSLQSLHALSELRLNDNRILTLPPSLASQRSLKLLDLGRNLFSTIEYVATASLSDDSHSRSVVGMFGRLRSSQCHSTAGDAATAA